MDQVKAAGGVDAPVVHDDSSSRWPLDQVPGLGQIPGLDQLPTTSARSPASDQIPGLQDLLNGDPSQALAAAAQRAAGQRPDRSEPRRPAERSRPGSGNRQRSGGDRARHGHVDSRRLRPGAQPDRDDDVRLGSAGNADDRAARPARHRDDRGRPWAERAVELRRPNGDVTCRSPATKRRDAATDTRGSMAATCFIKVTGDSFVTPADVKAIAEQVEAVR